MLRTLVLFATVAVAGMALLPETPANAGVGKDPATAYAPASPAAAGTQAPVKTIEVVARRFAFEPATIEVTQGDRVRLIVTSADGTKTLKYGVNNDGEPTIDRG